MLTIFLTLTLQGVGIYYVDTSALDNNSNPVANPNPKPTLVMTADAPTRPTSEDGRYLYLLTQFGEDRCTQFRVIVVTDPHTKTHSHPLTDRTNYNTLRRS